MSKQQTFQSSIPFDQRIQAAAVYCSDGRFGDQVDEFLHQGLGVGQYDRVILPGGPAALAGHDPANVQAEGVLADLKFLIEAHGLDRVVLIAHDGCAFYSQALGLDDTQREPKQHADLRAAAEWIRREVPGPSVEAYFARRTPEDSIAFEPVPVG